MRSHSRAPARDTVGLCLNWLVFYMALLSSIFRTDSPCSFKPNSVSSLASLLHSQHPCPLTQRCSELSTVSNQWLSIPCQGVLHPFLSDSFFVIPITPTLSQHIHEPPPIVFPLPTRAPRTVAAINYAEMCLCCGLLL